MALQDSGIITMADIASEFGGTMPHGLDEYYGAAAGVPASGQVSLQDFYGVSNGVSKTFVCTGRQDPDGKIISTHTIGYESLYNGEFTISPDDQFNGFPLYAIRILSVPTAGPNAAFPPQVTIVVLDTAVGARGADYIQSVYIEEFDLLLDHNSPLFSNPDINGDAGYRTFRNAGGAITGYGWQWLEPAETTYENSLFKIRTMNGVTVKITGAA